MSSGEAKSVRVRVAVIVGEKGDWCASGWSSADDDAMEEAAYCGVDSPVTREFYIEATLPLPSPLTLEAEIAEGGGA